MSQPNDTKSTWKQALLVVAGIVIAILLSVRSFVITPSAAPVVPTSSSPDTTTTTRDEKEVTKKEEAGGGSPNINSTARLFQYFTENLPYLNSK